jgi:HKD family nuclease
LELRNDIENGLLKSHIDINAQSKYEYQSRLLTNDKNQRTKVLTSIVNELRACNEFYFSVAFVTNSGVATLVNTLKELEDKGIKGKILASQYQNFTEPNALERLLKFKNIQLKIVTEGNFHAKGYIFRHSVKNIQDVYTLIVGSSNLTSEALSTNKEWNLKVSSLSDGALLKNTIEEFNNLFDNAEPVTKEWISEYNKIYNEKKY